MTQQLTAARGQMQEIKANVHRRLLQTLDLLEAQRMPVHELHEACLQKVDDLLDEQHCPLSTPEKQQLLREVMDEIFGLGPLEEFLRDRTISDILCNGPCIIYVERDGRLVKTNATFRDDNHLMQVIQRIASRVGRRIDESSPMLDARLADGSRVNAIIGPLALDGPALSVRRFGTIPLNVESLVELGTMAGEMALFLEACVRCRMNTLISGGTGTGKTTLLNVLSKWIPDGERVVTIEDAAELQLQRDHVVRLETRPPNIEAKGEITQRDLLRNSLRMRPDRIIIGEVRGPEALDMLQAMNTGHEGSMTTVHANNPRDALSRVENMVSMAGLNFPIHAIRQQMSSALNLLVHLTRVTGGRRKVTAISEITGMESDTICLGELFRYRQTGVDGGRAVGRFEACGVRPRLLGRLEDEGVTMPSNMFQQRVLDGPAEA
ncbi:MAG TPA: CpaF family protein [Phycisphaerae bacterium]|nr:CpaF family protein [Phycisphaerae bacterium]HUU20975.1 CpaF family protein [Phycisphaerae bacterium]